VVTAVGPKAVAKRRSLGNIIRSRLSRAVKPSWRSLSADRAVQRPSDLEPTEDDLDPGSLTQTPQSTHRTSVGKFLSSSTELIYLRMSGVKLLHKHDICYPQMFCMVRILDEYDRCDIKYLIQIIL